MKFTVHTSLFNIIKNSYDVERSIGNWAEFLSLMPEFHEIILVVNTSEDNTLQYIKDLAIKFRKQNVNIEVLESNIPYSDPAFDGKIKDVGFQASSGDYNILLDGDEVAPLYSTKSWIQAANHLKDSEFDALLIP